VISILGLPSSFLLTGQAMDHPPDPLYERKTSFASDRLMEVAEANSGTWTVGFLDECWWSRVALPTLSSFTEESKLLRLLQRSPKTIPSPKPSPATDSICGRSRSEVAALRGG
jgi:hypothetical protein